MASVNKVILVGNLGRDPETRSLPSGDQVTNIAIATTDKWKDKNSGEQMESTEWHRVSFFGRLAEIAGQYLRKGSQVYIEGKLQTRKWVDKDGVEKYSTEIRADSMQLLGSRDGGQGGGNTQQQPQQRQQPQQPQRQQAPAPRNGYADARGQAQPQQRQAPTHAGSGFDDMDDDIPF